MTGRPSPRSAAGTSLRERLTELGYLAGWRLVRHLPRALVWPAFAYGAGRAARRGGRGVRRMTANYRQVVGPDVGEAELAELVQAGLRSYARYWMEAFRLPSYQRADVLAAVHADGADRLGAALAQGRGVIVALPHAANWDLAGAWVAAQGWPIATVAERLRPEALFTRFVEYRRRLGMEIIPLSGGDRSVLEVLVERLAGGCVVPLVAERDLSARGVEVTFFGSAARMPPGPALLALRTGAPLFVASLWYEADRCCVYLDGPLPVPGPQAGPFGERVRALTQDVADRMARGIAAHPADWHMMQRIWTQESQ